MVNKLIRLCKGAMQIMCSTFLGKEAENEEDVERKETKGILGGIIFVLPSFLIIAVFVAYPCAIQRT